MFAINVSRERESEIKHFPSGHGLFFVISADNRTLKLGINTHMGFAYSHLSQERSNPKPKGLTTALYSEASRLIQEAADQTGIPVIYTLDTENPNMIAWALERGSELFHWDNISRREGLIASKTFYPQNS